ncbi:S8 family serine peptidase [Myroides phaeus]|uniref:S8 family serine peptidase n=1 Tax=Myroides phaeus TaxID=702745 RepID=UPI0013030511|nr:S8 family serine peptidase [Myroides phaeus]
MKKITLFAFLAVPLFSLQMRGQDLQTRTKVVATYDVASAKMEIEKIAIDAQQEKEKAFEIAEKLGVQTSGISPKGNYYELVRVDEGGVLFYRTTLGMGSRATQNAENIPVGTKGVLLEGKDMLVGVIDGMSALSAHREFITSPSDKKSRVTEKDAISRVPSDYKSKREYESSRAHATHVSGIIAAAGFYVGGEAKGIAPKSNVLSYNWGSDTSKMTTMAVDGVLVSNHSYGAKFFDDYGTILSDAHRNLLGAYDLSSYRFDQIANKYPYYLPVTAAGNDGGDQAKTYLNYPNKKNVDMLNGTSVSKNVVVVAAIHEVPYYTGPQDVKLAYFSSQGPSDDFRIKPDIAAKGVSVYSTTYYAPENPNDTPDTHRNQNMDGTSMAAPAVTAVFALWQEWASKYSVSKMPYTAATIRALMAHTADEAGSAPGPDHLFGWGLLNAKNGVNVMEGASVGTSASIKESTLKQDEKFKTSIEVKEKNKKVVVTLAWNDPAFKKYASSYGYNEKTMIDNPTLVNDLDIVVVKGDKTYLPWRLTKSHSNLKAERGNNNVDNIEKIEFTASEVGTYEIVISHKGSLEGGKQDYSLITSVGEFKDLDKPDYNEGKPEDKEGEKPGDKEGENPVIESDSFGIWPNPVADQMYINMNSRYIDEVAHVRVFDIDGRMVRDFKGFVGADGKLTVNMASLTVGSYFVEVKTGKFKKKVRIMKR